jgi:DNA-binding response OmpR family regulator
MRLLVVEDDDRVGAALAAVLTRHGFDVVRERTGQAALDSLDDSTGMVLLDLGLPDRDGFEICSRIRRISDVPIIMVTARADLRSRIHGLGLGADDYLVKPFDLGELVARIHAVSRRKRSDASPVEAHEEQVRVRDVVIDLAARSVSVSGQPITLTRKEFDIIALLARHRGLVMRRERIISEVWQANWDSIGRSLEVHMASLRAKLAVPDVIETIRGVGYRMVSQ